jgi:anti-sigma B factor antagonist
MINGVPVVTTPAEIDVTSAEQLRIVLLQADARRPDTVVVDMTRTRFCDSAGLTVLVQAHKRALAEGGEMRLVIPAGGAVARILAITRIDQVIPLFGSLDEALAPGPVAAIGSSRPRAPAGGRPGRRPGLPGRRA